ncbi:hypothetical protein [Dethiothermospora halolimnae]|uniref:hypothetical protein n=1 Tax=Dethiothermospora halolimnae TaxID=3114390 RepID=UPI003CCBAEDC
MGKKYGKKSYMFFIIWLIGFFIILITAGLFIEKNFEHAELSTGKILLLLTLILLNILFYIIYKTEKVYWINGTSYKEAKAATSKRRKVFAIKHLKSFFVASCIYLIYCIFSFAINSLMIDSLVFTIVLIVAAISTIRYKL